MPWLLEAWYPYRKKKYIKECHETYASATESRLKHWENKSCKRVRLTLVKEC